MNSLCLRPSCYACPFAQKQRVADITIGDFWGIEHVLPDFAIGNGVSLVTINSVQGKEVFQQASEYMTVSKVNFDRAVQYNEQLARPSRPHDSRDAFMQDVLKMPFDEVCTKYEKRRSASRQMLSHLFGRDVKKALKGLLKR